ncbi:MAG: hypothetical protein K9L87_04860 [Candidatus Omnitrophica bacterium]|nr:hypothetical protein [Candidatus Omnitrophota bacterium]MCF7895798.1 hypothetical protein [Candidatus Omnitrophota bacterium]MCF7898057.1 hypothetical protein [Candidatus Omnitrophota bacterium]
MRKLIINHVWWAMLVIAIFLLIAHTLSIQEIVVDNTTLTLLIIIIIIPFIPYVKKIKLGNFEAEISPREIQKVKEEVEIQLSEPEKISPEINKSLKILEKIKKLSKDDPVLALAKLRIEIEKIITRLHVSTNMKSHIRRSPSLVRMIMELSYDEILSTKISHSLREVVSICNRAIHGEEIRKQDVEIIIHIGVELLNFLYTETPNIITKETEEIIIDNKNVDEYMSAKYKVTTVVPLVEKPKKKIYILNQQELDEFFDGYNEFAEFIVGIKKNRRK